MRRKVIVLLWNTEKEDLMDYRRSLIKKVEFVFMILCIVLVLNCRQVYGADDTQTITITKDGQSVDKFCNVKSYYILGSSNTGNYCCAAYVKRFYAALYNVMVSRVNTYAGPPVVSGEGKNVSLRQVSVPQPGDIMQNTAYSHVAIVKSVNGNEVTLIEQNWKWTSGGVVYTKVNRKIDIGSAYFYRLVINGKDVAPVKKASEPKDHQVWQISATGGINLRKSYSETSGIRTTIPYNTILNITQKKMVSGKAWGKTMYNGKNGWILLSNACYIWGKISAADKEPPVLSNVKVSRVTGNGYKITCKVKDNVGVARVQFPTWTSFDGQDDLVSDWAENPNCSGTINGDTVTFKVNRKEHNGEYGIYNTHIYAYDAAGNVVGAVVPTVEVGVASGLEDDFYAYICNKKSGRYITSSGNYPFVSKYKGNNKQMFRFVKQDDGYYTIESVNLKKALYVKKASDGYGSYVRFGKLKNSAAWHWRIYGREGAYVFRNKTSDEVIMLKLDKLSEGNRLRMNGQKNSNTFTFKIIQTNRRKK